MCILLYVKLIWCSGVAWIHDWLMGAICFGYMCIVLYMKLIWCHGFLDIYAQLEEWGWGQSAMGICALCYIWKLFGVMVFHRSMLNCRREVGSICNRYMCILLYVKCIWCSGVAWIYDHLRGVHLPWVCVHCAIYETYLVSWFSTDLCSIAGGRWGQSAIGICAFCYMWNLFGVVVLHGSMIFWGGSICLGYMCIVLYIYIWNLCSVMVLHRSMLVWGAHLPNMCCNGFPEIYAQLEEGVQICW